MKALYSLFLVALLAATTSDAQERRPSPPPQPAEYGVADGPEIDRLVLLGLDVRREGGRAYVSPATLQRAKALGVPLRVVSARLTRGRPDGLSETNETARTASAGTATGSSTNDVQIPDHNGQPGFSYMTVDLSAVPSGATVTNVRYRVRVQHAYLSDLRLFVWKNGATALIWDREGGRTDGGADDDPEDDDDIYLNWRETSALNGQAVDGWWSIDAYDHAGGDVGFIDYAHLEVEFDGGSGTPELSVSPTSVSASVASGGTATRLVTVTNAGGGTLSWSAGASSARTASARPAVRAAPSASLPRVAMADRPLAPTLAARAGRDGTVPVIVRLNVDYDLGPVEGARRAGQAAAVAAVRTDIVALAEAAGADRVRALGQLPFVAMEATPAVLEALATSPDVASIELDALDRPHLDESVALVGGDAAHAAGHRGAGWSVAVLDTGVDVGHPDFDGPILAEACFSSNSSTATSLCPSGQDVRFGPGSAAPPPASVDGYRHGTHVAATAVGSRGVAPEAGLVAVQVFRRYDDPAICDDDPPPCALSSVSDQVAALDWVYQNRGSLGVAAVNMSLGGGRYTSVCDDGSARYAATAQLAAAGVVVVASAGNKGYDDAMGSPACYSTTASVGNTGDGSGGVGVDAFASSSNTAPFLDLAAPGTAIRAAVPGGGRATMSGTSMAAPHVAGAVALLRAQNPGWSADQIVSRLQSTGVPVSRGARSWPRIQVDAALGVGVGGGSDWLAVSPAGGTLTAGESETVTLTLDADGLSDGSYDGTATVSSNGGTETVDVALAVGGGSSGSGPDLEVTAASLSATSAAPGTSLTAEMTVANVGTERVLGTEWHVAWFWSTDGVWDPSDIELNRDRVASNVVLQVGNDLDRDDPVTVPEGAAPGTHYVLAVADVDDTIAEADESQASNVAATAITVTGGTQAAVVVASPSSVSFGEVAVGDWSDRPVVVTNTGGAATYVTTSVSGTGFAVWGLVGTSLGPGESTTLDAVFEPSAAGSVSGSLTMSYDAAGAPSSITVPLSGTGVASGSGVAVSLPTMEAGVGTPVEVPVTLGAPGVDVLAYTLAVEFDPAVVEITGAVTGGTLSDGFSVQTNVPSPGRLVVSAAGSEPITAGGTLVRLSATPVAAGTSPLTLAEVRLNEGSPAAQAQSGQITVTDCPACGDANGSGGAPSALDASAILRATVGVVDDAFFPCAADVTGDGSISGLDAARVLQATVGIPGTLTCAVGRVAQDRLGGSGATWRVVGSTADTTWIEVVVPTGASAVRLDIVGAGQAWIAGVPDGWLQAEAARGDTLAAAVAAPHVRGGVVRLGVVPTGRSGSVTARVVLDEGAPVALGTVEARRAPTVLALGAPAPNPTRGDVRLRVDLDQAATVRLVVVDALGRRVWSSAPTRRQAGRFEASVPSGALAPGVYAVVLDADGRRAIRRLTVVR